MRPQQKSHAQSSTEASKKAVKKKLTVFLPESLDLDSLVKEHPTIEVAPDANKRRKSFDPVELHVTTLKWMVGMIIYFWTIQRDDERGNRGSKWVNIPASFWDADVHRHYKDHLRWLVEQDVILENPHYSNDPSKRFTKSYALANRFQNVVLVPHTISKSITYTQKSDDDVTIFLNEWLKDERLAVDIDLATRIAKTLTVEQQNSWLLTSEAFKQRSGGTRDTTSYRFHSAITRTPKSMRSAITFEGENLVSIDVSNSQPYFLSLLLNEELQNQFDEFKSWVAKVPFLSLDQIQPPSSLFEYIYSDFYSSKSLSQSPPPLYTDHICTSTACDSNQTAEMNGKKSISESEKEKRDCQKHKNGANSNICTGAESPETWSTTPVMQFGNMVATDIQKFIITNQAGQFYECLAELWALPRKDAKFRFMLILFGRNRYRSVYEKRFQAEFPHVYDFIREAKKDGHEKLAIELQRLESMIVIDKACSYLMCNHKDVPIFTLHDSLLTTEENVDLVAGVLKEQFKKAYVTVPKLKIEDWVSPNHQDLFPENAPKHIEEESEYGQVLHHENDGTKMHDIQAIASDKIAPILDTKDEIQSYILDVKKRLKAGDTELVWGEDLRTKQGLYQLIQKIQRAIYKLSYEAQNDV